MSKRSRRRKHAPQRTCVACRQVRTKRDLVRVVRTSEGAVVLDETGKQSGRGAYLCRQRSCWEKALSRQDLHRALKVKLTVDAESMLRAYAAELPESMTAEREEKGAEYR